MTTQEFQKKIKRVLITEQEIQDKIQKVGAQISREYEGKPLPERLISPVLCLAMMLCRENKVYLVLLFLSGLLHIISREIFLPADSE